MSWNDQFYDYDIPAGLKGMDNYHPGVEGNIRFRDEAPIRKQEDRAYVAGKESKNYSGIGPKNWKRADERIRDEICERLTHDPDVDATDIEVDVNEGVVTLRGFVFTRTMKRKAEDDAEQSFGVRDVRNELIINA